MLQAAKLVTAILTHPMNREGRLRALGRFLAWQSASRLAPGPILVPFANGTSLAMSRGMTGATGNLYFGLAEWEEMAFAAHLLRPGDLFVDIGANIGAFTVLAAGAAGADCIAVEPIPATFRLLERNIRANGLDGRVTALNAGLGAEAGALAFIDDRDTMNRVAVAGEHGTTVPVTTLDTAVAGRRPVLVKIDVEGFEMAVIEGGRQTLGGDGLLAVIVETNGQETRYGYPQGAVADALSDLGFARIRYDPPHRALRPATGQSQNAIFVRKPAKAEERVGTAPPLRTVASSL